MPTDFKSLLVKFTEIIDIFIVVIIALTVTVVIWNIFSALILNGGDQMSMRDSKKTIFIGFIVLFIMSTVWGIVALLRSAII